MSRHTPGPWLLAGGRWICAEGGKLSIAVMENEDDWEEEQEANARLITAAPELVAALEEAAEKLEMAAKDLRARKLTGTPSYLELVASKATTLLAKLEGGAK